MHAALFYFTGDDGRFTRHARWREKQRPPRVYVSPPPPPVFPLQSHAEESFVLMVFVAALQAFIARTHTYRVAHKQLLYPFFSPWPQNRNTWPGSTSTRLSRTFRSGYEPLGLRPGSGLCSPTAGARRWCPRPDLPPPRPVSRISLCMAPPPLLPLLPQPRLPPPPQLLLIRMQVEVAWLPLPSGAPLLRRARVPIPVLAALLRRH